MADKPQDVEVTFTINGVTSQTVYVRGFTAQEAMSQLFQVELDLATDKDKPLDLSKMVGETAWLTLKNGQGTRYFHGILSRFSALSLERKFILYNATLVPRAWRLLHRRDSRIFQGDTLEDIVVTKVLKPANITNKIRLAGGKKPPKREYCVQYRESDWSFISRLLEEEGYFYYFEHTQSSHTLHLSNDTSSYASYSNNSYDYHPATSGPAQESVLSFQFEERVRTGKVVLNDFNFLKPSLPQKKDPEKVADANTDLELYDYPGLYPFPSFEEQEGGDDQVGVKDKHAKAMPDIRLQEQQADRKLGIGSSDSIRLCPGYCVAINKLYDSKAPKDYLLTMVIHTGEKHGDLEAGATQSKLRYSNQFVCIPKTVPFRPPRVTPRPFVQGPQTAIVTGPGGSEIYTDKLGRVKVIFHWDRLNKKDQTSSCWVRVSQLWAGQNWGAMFIPRIGHEVVVDFLEGDPDRPIITGRVYHATNKPPYTLPTEMTKSTIKSNSSKGGNGYNEITFEDLKGSEQIITHAQKDQNETIKNNLSTSVGNDQTHNVGHDQTVKIKNKQDIDVGGDRWVHVKGYDNSWVEGNQDYTVDGPGGAALHVLNNYGVDAMQGIDILGETKGVNIKGTGTGVKIVGEGGGVNIKGTGPIGVVIHGVSDTIVKGDSEVLIDAPTVNIQPGVINISGTTVTITAGGATITVGSSGIDINGAGKLVTVSGSMIKLN